MPVEMHWFNRCKTGTPGLRVGINCTSARQNSQRQAVKSPYLTTCLFNLWELLEYVQMLLWLSGVFYASYTFRDVTAFTPLYPVSIPERFHIPTIFLLVRAEYSSSPTGQRCLLTDSLKALVAF
jgi:hypothetical protein